MPSKIESDFSNFFSFSLLLSPFLGGVGGGHRMEYLGSGISVSKPGMEPGPQM